MAIILYELCGRDPGLLFSPHCWKAKMALAHKGLAVESRPTPYRAIKDIGRGFSPTVPVIDDGGRLVGESFDIAVYLEETYPDRPSLFGGAGGLAMSRFVESWTLVALNPLIRPLIILDIHAALEEPDGSYFRRSREKLYGMSLEQMQADRKAQIGVIGAALAPLRSMLAKQPFIGGVGPLFADYLAFGSLQWARVFCPLPVLAGDDPVAGWFDRCLDLYGGLGRTVRSAA